MPGALLAGGEIEALRTDCEMPKDGWSTTAGIRNHRKPLDEMVVVDEEEFRRLPGSIAVFRAGHALVLGDVPATVKYAQQVLDLVPEDDHLPRGAAAALLGLASWRSGDLEKAHRMFADGISTVQLAGAIPDASMVQSHLLIYGLRKVDSAMRCVPMSGDYNLQQRRRS